VPREINKKKNQFRITVPKLKWACIFQKSGWLSQGFTLGIAETPRRAYNKLEIRPSPQRERRFTTTPLNAPGPVPLASLSNMQLSPTSSRPAQTEYNMNKLGIQMNYYSRRGED
jgi:hypothetical protein